MLWRKKLKLLCKHFNHFLFFTLVFYFGFTASAHADFKPYADVRSIQLDYFSDYPESEDVILERLQLDTNIHLRRNPAHDFEHTHTFVIHNTVLEAATATHIQQKVKRGEAGLVIIAGENLSADFLSELLEQNVKVHAFSQAQDNSESKFYGKAIHWQGNSTHPLAQQIPWKSSVQIQELSIVQFEQTTNNNFNILAATVPEHTEQAHPVLVEAYLDKGKVYILTPWFKKGNDAQRLEYLWSVLLIKHEGAYNYTFYNWAYFNWLLNFISYDSAGIDSAKFSKWPHSPIPDATDNLWLFSSLFIVLLVSVFGFVRVRQYSLRHPEILQQIRIADYDQIKQARLKRLKRRIKTSPRFLVLPMKGYYWFNKLVFKEIADSSKQWEEIGFIRPLAGFQMIVSCIYLSVLPVLIFAAIMLNYVIPFPQSIGMTSWVSGAFSLLFTIFDLGTGIAMIKYFAEYRVKQPDKAMHYIQFYIWFQLISGIIQITLLSIATASMAPDSAYGFLTWIILFKLLTQFPGFATVFHNIFRALQRYDLMILTWVLPVPFTVPFIFIGMIWLRHFGLANPEYGEVMGISLGNVVPVFVGTWLYIIFSLVIYKALGFSLKATFCAHFDMKVVKQSLNFGLRYTPGAIAPMLSGFALPLILSVWLNNYLELNSLLAVALWINFLIRAPGYMLYSNLLPSISEAFSHQRKILSSHYIDQALKWSLMFLGGILPYFIVLGEDVAAAIMPEQWAAASQFIALAVIFGAIEFLSALPDETFKAVGKPQLFTLVNMFDHLLRIVLMLVLIPQFQIHGVLYAFIIAASIRCLLSWFILANYILKIELSWWQSIVTPAIVTLVIFIIALFIKQVYQVDSPQEALPLVLIFFVISPVFYFITAVLGGFDDKNLKEFKKATNLNIVTRLLGFIPLWPTALGVRLSPLHNRFPMKNWDAAQQEAHSLTQEKVRF